MPNVAVLISKAHVVLGDETTITAAGVLGLQDNYKALFASGLAAGAVVGDVPGGALTSGVVGAASTHMARDINAEAQGVTTRMLVALTPETIHLLALPAVGSTPERELLRLSRDTTTCSVKKIGLSRRIYLTDSATGTEIGLSGSMAPFSAYAAGTKSVLSELAS
jgi:hypothetical protein